MNFFKSILSDDPDPPKPESDPNSSIKPSLDPTDAVAGEPSDGWSFGGLIKTLAIESVIETYRKDLQEFGSGLKKETEMLRDTASRAVKDLPASIEAAHGAIDGVLRSTAEIISKETLVSDGENNNGSDAAEASRKYSWFDSQLSAIRSDSATFREDPEDLDEYGKWKLGFEIERFRNEIDSLIGENGDLEGVYERLVPGEVDRDTFWCRYFYRVDRLRQQESVRAKLVRRAISVDDDDDEELSWDVDEDDEGDGDGSESESESRPILKKEDDAVESSGNSNVGVSSDEKVISDGCVEEKSDGKVGVVEKSYASVVSSNSTKVEDEEDMGWDEIEDVESVDEKKNSVNTQSGGSPDRSEVRKRLSGVEDDDDDDDLNWDIEDDDEPAAKA